MRHQVIKLRKIRVTTGLFFQKIKKLENTKKKEKKKDQERKASLYSVHRTKNGI